MRCHLQNSVIKYCGWPACLPSFPLSLPPFLSFFLLVAHLDETKYPCCELPSGEVHVARNWELPLTNIQQGTESHSPTTWEEINLAKDQVSAGGRGSNPKLWYHCSNSWCLKSHCSAWEEGSRQSQGSYKVQNWSRDSYMKYYTVSESVNWK